MTKDKKKSDEKQRDRLLKERETSDLKFLLKTVQFRRYVKRFTKFCGVLENTFRGDIATGYNAGVNSVGNKMIKEVLEVSPEMFIQMYNEYASESKSIENEKKDEIEEIDILKIDA